MGYFIVKKNRNERLRDLSWYYTQQGSKAILQTVEPLAFGNPEKLINLLRMSLKTPKQLEMTTGPGQIQLSFKFSKSDEQLELHHSQE